MTSERFDGNRSTPEQTGSDFWIPPTRILESYELVQKVLAEKDLNINSMFYILAAATVTHHAENYRKSYGNEYQPMLNYANYRIDPYRNSQTIENPFTQVQFRLRRHKPIDDLPRIESVGAIIKTRGKRTISNRFLFFYRNPDGNVADTRSEFKTDFSGTLIPGSYPLDKIRTQQELLELAGYIEESLELLMD